MAALDRIDASALGEGGAEGLLRTLRGGSAIVGPDGARFDLPEPLVRFLAHAARAVRHGGSVALVPEREALTTQEAADRLGVSRPFLIGLLEKGEIPFHRTGAHRRILARDLAAYQTRRDRERRKVLDDLFDAIDADGFYELGLDSELGLDG